MRIVIIIGLVVYIWAARHHQPAQAGASQEHQQAVFNACIAMSVRAMQVNDDAGSTYWHREAIKSYIEMYGEPPTLRQVLDAAKGQVK